MDNSVTPNEPGRARYAANEADTDFDFESLLDVSDINRRCHDSKVQAERKAIEQFTSTFPEFAIPQAVAPRFTWEQLERQLCFLAGTSQRRTLAADRVATIRKLSAHKPDEMILQEILIEAWVLLDEEPHGLAEEDGATD